MKTELEAAKRRIAELEQQLGEQRDASAQDGDAIHGVTAAVGLATLFGALRTRLNRRHRGELDRIRAAFELEREHRRTEMAAEREQTARRDADHRQQADMLSLRVERAEQSQREAATALGEANQIVEELRISLAEEANVSWQQTFELAKVRAANAHLEESLTTERHDYKARAKNLLECVDQRDAALNEMQQAYSELERRAETEHHRLTEDNQRLQKRLAQREARLKRDRAAVADAPKSAPRQRFASLVIVAAPEDNTEGPTSSNRLHAAPQHQPEQMRLAPADAAQTERQPATPRKNREQSATNDHLQARTKSATKRKKRSKKKKKSSRIGQAIAAAGHVVTGAVTTGLAFVQIVSGSSGKSLTAKPESRRLGAASKKE